MMETSDYLHKFCTRAECMTRDTSKGMEKHFCIEDIQFNRYYIDKSILKDKAALVELESIFQHVCPYNNKYIVKVGINTRKSISLLYLDKEVYTFKRKGKLSIKRKKVEKDFNYRILL